MLALNYQLTVYSANKKTGGMPVSTSDARTCPKSCPFLNNGCYAAIGPLALHWAKVTSGERGMPYQAFLGAVSALPKGTLWRHNQAGDLYAPGSIQGGLMLQALVQANKGRRGYTYSHHRLTKTVAQRFADAKAQGFTVNASVQSEKAADRAISLGVPVAMVVQSTESRRHWKTKAGNTVQVCPGQLKESVTCASCQLCQDRRSDLIIAFKAHGVAKRKVDQILQNM